MISIPIIAIYSRKSKFTGKGESIQNQIELCKEYAIKNFSVEKFLVFEDEGYSGSNSNRPKYQELLEEARIGNFHILICYRLDRISRNISDFTYLVEMLNKNDISFISIRENFDTSTPIGRAMMFIASVFSQLERETMSERIKDNMYSLAKGGRWLGGRTPTGFISKEVIYYDENNNKRRLFKLSPNDNELQLVKRLYDKYIELGSLSKLEAWTTKNNIKTRNNKSFDKSILSFILSNPVYTIADRSIYDYFSLHDSEIADDTDKFNGINGLMVYNKHDEKKNKTVKRDKSKWIVAVGLHHGIIPSKTWIKVQNRLKENSKKAPRAGTGKIGLLTNSLKCKNCGSRMRISVSRRKDKVYYYYKCLTKEKSKGERCNVNNINGRVADTLVLKKITTIEYNKKDIYKGLKNLLKNIQSISTNSKLDDIRLIAEIKNYEIYINNLTLQLSKTENTNTSKYIIKQIEEFDENISRLKSMLKKHYEDYAISKNLENNFTLLSDLIDDVDHNIDNLRFEEKKNLISLLVAEITWDGHTLDIVCYNRN